MHTILKHPPGEEPDGRFTALSLQPMTIRIRCALLILPLLIGCGPDISRTVELTPAKLGEIRETPYVGGNGPGGFATARLEPGNSPRILFTGFGPYLHEMGFVPGMSLTHIDAQPVDALFAERWAALRLGDATAYDAAHYADLIRFLFVERDGGRVDLTVEIGRGAALATDGAYRPGTETWRIILPR